MATWKKQLCMFHDRPIVFILSQWQHKPKPNIIYLVYRWIFAMIFFVSLIMGIVDLEHPNVSVSYRVKFTIYMTHWNYSMCTIQSLLVAVMVSLCALGNRLQNTPNLEKRALKLYKIYWVTNIIATDNAFVITTLYWIFVFEKNTVYLDVINLLMHANNSVMMMLDLFVVSHPVWLIHCCYSALFGICYLLFSIIYYEAGGTGREGYPYIYVVLDWRKTGATTGFCFGAIFFVIIVHIIVWGLYKLRLWIHLKCFYQEDEWNEEDTPNSSYYDGTLSRGSDVTKY